MAAPLYELTKKNKAFKLESEQADAIGRIKTTLQAAVVDTILPPEDGWNFMMMTDASNIGIGATVEQRRRNSDPRTIGFFSKLLKDTQRRYSTSEREFLAVIKALKHFEPIVGGYPITVLTDHQPLVALSKAKDPCC